MNRKEILNKAEEIINGDREGTYGKPEDSFDRIAQLWSVYLNHDISSVDVANMMVLLKVARNAGGVYKDDNWIDICGYAALGGEIQSQFDYDSFAQYMNKPVEEGVKDFIGKSGTSIKDPKGDKKDLTWTEGVPRRSGRYPWNENFMDVKDIEFDSLSDAVRTWLRVKTLIAKYGSCSVSDYFCICGESGVKYSDTKYGWNDLDEFEYGQVISLSEFGKWVLKMPAAVRLDERENE